METTRDMFQTQNARRRRMIWPAAVILIAAIGGAAWHFGPRFFKQDAAPMQIQTAQASSMSDILSARLDSAEQKLSSFVNDRSGLADKALEIEKTLGAGVRRARAETTALVEGVKREMTRGFDALNSRMTGIESNQREAHDVVAKLQSDLDAVRRELDTVRETNAKQASKLQEKLQEMEQAQVSAKTEISQIQNQALTNARKVDALSHEVERQSVNFEVSKARTEEVVPGIYLTVHRTDVAKQHVDGWVQIASEGRFIRLDHAGAQNPVSFSSRSDERPYSLVFTRITNAGVAGYVLVPAAPTAPAGTGN